jgi:hypothetical protein
MRLQVAVDDSGRSVGATTPVSNDGGCPGHDLPLPSLTWPNAVPSPIAISGSVRREEEDPCS